MPMFPDIVIYYMPMLPYNVVNDVEMLPRKVVCYGLISQHSIGNCGFFRTKLMQAIAMILAFHATLNDVSINTEIFIY